MMKSAGALHQVGSFSVACRGSWFPSQKSWAMQESPNATDADVMLLFRMTYKQLLCKVL